MRAPLITATLLSLSLNAQTTFAPIGASWSYTQRYVGSPDSALFTLNCVGDTSIAGVYCSVLAHAGGISECMGFRSFVGVAGDSVLTWDPVDSLWRTLYVFGLPVGEGWSTIVARGYSNGGNWSVVHDTLMFQVTLSDTVTIDGVMLRRSTVIADWSLEDPHQTVAFGGTITERLGHAGYLFPWIDGPCDFEYNGPSRCYEDPDITWLNPQFTQCELSTSVGEPPTTTAFEVYPSVVERGGTITIRCAARASIELVDATGRTVRSLPFNTSFTIDRPGFYWVRARASQGSVRVRGVTVH